MTKSNTRKKIGIKKNQKIKNKLNDDRCTHIGCTSDMEFSDVLQSAFFITDKKLNNEISNGSTASNARHNASAARHDAINIQISNAGAWAHCTERVSVNLPLELEDYIPEVKAFYKRQHAGRKSQWYHRMSN